MSKPFSDSTKSSPMHTAKQQAGISLVLIESAWTPPLLGFSSWGAGILSFEQMNDEWPKADIKLHGLPRKPGQVTVNWWSASLWVK